MLVFDRAVAIQPGRSSIVSILVLVDVGLRLHILADMIVKKKSFQSLF